MQRALLIVSFLLFPCLSAFARGTYSSSGDNLVKLLPIGVIVLVGLIAAAINASKKSTPISPAQLAQLQAETTDFLNSVEAGRFTPPQTSLILAAGESALLNEPSKLLEARATRLYAGGGTRVQGIYVGGGQSTSVQSLKEIDSGTLTLTNQRLVFTGSMESRVVKFKDIVSVGAMADAIELSIANKAKRQVYIVHNPILWGALLRSFSPSASRSA